MSEEFKELFEQYLDEDLIEAKKREDEKEIRYELHHTNKHVESRYTINDAIMIGDFVNNYLDIEGDCSNLWLSGLKDLNSPFLFGVSNDFANENVKLVRNRTLLLVIDGKGHRGTYVNPNLIKNILDFDYEDYEKQKEIEKRLDDFRKAGVQNLDLLGEYMARCLELADVRDKVAAYEEQLAITESGCDFMQLMKDTHKMGQFQRLRKKEIKND